MLVYVYCAIPPSHVGFAKNSAKSSGDIVPSSSSPSPNRPSSTSTSDSCSEDLGRDSDVVLVLTPLQALPINDPRLVPPHAVVPTLQEATLGAWPTPAAAASRAAELVLHLMLGGEIGGKGANLTVDASISLAQSVHTRIDVGGVGVFNPMLVCMGVHADKGERELAHTPL